MKSKKGLNVLSLFDGMSGGQIALERAGINVSKYYAAEIDKYAITVTQANYPNTIQLGDVTKWREWDIDWSSIVLLIGGSPCFVSGTKIITSDSLTPIEDVRVGDEVLTHKGLYRKVLRVGGKTSEIYELQSQSGTLTETTENHPYYVRKRSKVWNNEKRSHEFKFNEPEFVKVKDLTKDHYLATPILKSAKNPMELTEDECFVIGLYIGDGHTRKDFRKTECRDNHRHWQLIISVGEHEKDLFSEKVKLKHSLYSHTQSTYRAVFSSKRLVSYVEEQCGCSSHTKHFGKGILDLPTHLLKKVIDGYLFADGSFRGNVHRVTTVSRSLVESLTLAVAKTFRTTTSVEYTTRSKTTEIQGRVVNQSDTWTVSFRENHPKQSRSWVLDDFIWNPIKKLIKTDKKKPVFNLEVEEDNSYVANNHVVHNCQGFSFAGKQLAFDDPRSKLFFVYVDILNHIRSANPDVKFMLENVKMKKEYLDVISEHLGVQPVFINSALVSAQNRQRYYWANWAFGQPEDKGITWGDVREHGVNEYYYTEKGLQWLGRNSQRKNKTLDVWGDDEKSQMIEASHYKNYSSQRFFGVCDLPSDSQRVAAMRGRYLVDGKRNDSMQSEKGNTAQFVEFRHDGKSNALSTVTKDNIIVPFTLPNRIPVDMFFFRYVTPLECERLQTVPDNYTNHVSNTQRYKMLGNGWTVDVIAHIFNSIESANEN